MRNTILFILGTLAMLCNAAIPEITLHAADGVLRGEEISLPDTVCDVMIGAEVVEIAPMTFAYRENIRSLKFESGSRLMTIGENAFRECKNLETAYLPEGLTEISRNAFVWCESLKNVHLPQTLRKIAAHAFAYCYSLRGIQFPSGLEEIGMNAFCYCSSLRQVELPDSITLLESYAFASCGSLRMAKLPGNSAMLGELIFASCPGLEAIYEPSAAPPEFECRSFISEPDNHGFYDRCILHIPEKAEDAYRNAPGWQLFRTISSISPAL